jgi:hypothetical protein
MWSKIVIKDLKTGLRTTGALLLGNSLVVPVLTEGKNHYWWILLIVGGILTVSSSFKDKE